MLESILIGSGFAFAAAIQPGPLQAFLLSSVTHHGWKRTLPASFSPLLSDGPIAILVLLTLNHLSHEMYRILQGAGGILLLYFAWAGYRRWKQNNESMKSNTVPQTLLQAALVNILNPNPYIGWTFVLGPACLAAWQKSSLFAIALIFSFYTTMVLVLGCIIVLFGTTRFLSPSGRRLLILISAIILAMLGVYQLSASILKAPAA
jgi:threonine/homoserine/homoserine lactone efflux protein